MARRLSAHLTELAPPSYQLARRARIVRSRTAGALLVSSVAHVVAVLFVALSWLNDVSVARSRPLYDDAAVQVAFVTLAPPRPEPATPAAPESAVDAPVPSRVATATRPPTPPPEARPAVVPPQPVEAPAPPPRPETRRQQADPVPATRPVTTARILRPDPSALSYLERSDGDVSGRRSVAVVADAMRPQSSPGLPPESRDDPGASTAAPPEPTTPSARRRAEMGGALRAIAEAASSGEGPSAVDIVFLLDVSGSMENNVRAVGENVSMMMAELTGRGSDATFGVVKFAIVTIRVFKQTRDPRSVENLLANLRIGGDERALTALVKAATRVKFRAGVQRRFILVTDEPLRGTPALSDVLEVLRSQDVVVDVIGLDIAEHRLLARATGGAWYKIPGEMSRAGT